jgi:hypothetical protein
MYNFWDTINYYEFEDLAYEYAKCLEPSWDWIKTPRTRDGGRDGHVTIYDKKTNVGHLKKEVWYEAKYTTKYAQALPLSRIASTVLIGRNYSNLVEKILIITNAFFTAKTIKEIKTALNGNVDFVTGNSLEEWLRDKKSIQFEAKHRNYEFLGSPLVIRPNSIYNVVSTNLNSLVVGEDYELFLALNVSPLSNNKIELEALECSEFVEIDLNYKISLSKGTNFISIPFKPLSPCKIDSRDPLIKFKEKNTGEILKIDIKLRIEHDTNIEVLNRSQANCEVELNKQFQEFTKLGHGLFLYLLEGAAGHGKSWTLESFIREKQDQEFIYLKFKQKNNEINNSWLLIKLLTFITFGKLFSDNKFDEAESLDELNEDICFLNESNDYNKYYTEYLYFLADDNNALENINKLLGKRELIPDTNANNIKIIYIFDVTSDEDSHQADHFVEQFQIEKYRLNPVYTGDNLRFFEKNVYLNKEDILFTSMTVKDFFARQSINLYDFGKINIMPNGDVYANLNHPMLGNIYSNNLHEIVHKEVDEGKSWFRIRNQVPCNDCVYQWLCPSPSNHEIAIGRSNLCHLNNT